MAYRLNQEKEDAIYDFIVASCPSATVIWDKPNDTVERPVKPYITLNVIFGPEKIGDRGEFYYKELDTFTYKFVKKFTLSVNIYADSYYLNIMNDLINSLDLSSKLSILRLKGLAIWGKQGPNDIPEVVDTIWEQRSHLDIFMSYGETVDDIPGEIQKVELNGQIIEIP